ncbi:hypothetical protein TNCV_718791 [Trichonephila clavipes]|nr:hypothetical protein TNCV_718791 [Trichonephila clavipes]
MITNFFIPELNNHDVQELWFQQDGATCHAARATIDLLKDTFGDRLISDKIRCVIADIRPQMLEKVIENWTSRLDYIRASRGSAMPEIIFKIVLGARAAGVLYRLFSVWTLVPVRLDQQLSDHSTVDEIASGAADCRLTYTMANCPQRRLEKPGERKKERENEKEEGKRARKRQGQVVLGSGEENPRVLLGDADQESETRMSKNALRTGRRQAVEQAKKEKVAEDRWVSQLIPLLPIEIAEIVAKEPLEKSDDYPTKKSTLGPVPTHTDSP